MIQESIFLMAVFDLAVVGVVIFAFGYFCIRINIVSKFGTYHGFCLILIGLFAIGLYHLTHLSEMIALPTVFPELNFMSLMTDLRLEVSWFVVLAGTSLIVAGLVLAGRGVLALVGTLEAAARDLSDELGANKRAGAMLNSTEWHLAKILEIAPAAIISIDRDHRIPALSTAAPC